EEVGEDRHPRACLLEPALGQLEGRVVVAAEQHADEVPHREAGRRSRPLPLDRQDVAPPALHAVGCLCARSVVLSATASEPDSYLGGRSNYLAVGDSSLTPAEMLQAASWARELKPIFRRRRWRWDSTVRCPIPNRPAISVLLRPSATSRAISRCRSVSAQG